MMRTVLSALIAAIVCTPASMCQASIIFSTQDKNEWLMAVNGPVTTIGFTDVFATIVKEQYADLGVHFTDGNDLGTNNGNFLDGFGIKGAVSGAGSITVQFDSPQKWIAVNYLGIVAIDLYMNGDSVGTKGIVQTGSGNKFFGLVSDVPFNSVTIYDPADHTVFIDDLHFFAPVPGPSGLALFLLAAPGLNRRRRR